MEILETILAFVLVLGLDLLCAYAVYLEYRFEQKKYNALLKKLDNIAYEISKERKI
jgi:hypothetical protein